MNKSLMRLWIIAFCFCILISSSFVYANDKKYEAGTTADVFKSIVVRSIKDFIRPHYKHLAHEAKIMAELMDDLCKQRSSRQYQNAQMQFSNLVDTWSHIELIRFGPARDNHRFERINFWPDRKGLGLRQVQRILAKHDMSALDVSSLQQKSVAVQGLGALEYILYGGGANELIEGKQQKKETTLTKDQGAFRCAYGYAVASALAENSSSLSMAWKNDAGYMHLMLHPGSNSPYRSYKEVVQDLIQSMTESLQFTRDIKILTVLGEKSAKAREKRAPFWRSNLTLVVIQANIEAVVQLFETGRFADALPQKESWLPQTIRFETKQAIQALEQLTMPFHSAIHDEIGRNLITFSTIAIGGAQQAIGDYYAERTNLGFGFNSLDGD